MPNEIHKASMRMVFKFQCETIWLWPVPLQNATAIVSIKKVGDIALKLVRCDVTPKAAVSINFRCDVICMSKQAFPFGFQVCRQPPVVLYGEAGAINHKLFFLRR